MAGRIADAQKNGLVFPARPAERLVAPRIPIDRIMLVLQQVRRLLAREAIGMRSWIHFAGHD
jgi:hypothetical protein